MARAFELARRGVARTHPNPMVGAVLVKHGRKVGEGLHVFDRRDHAEIVALKQARERARGATLYVTLEPCCTAGRTAPCTKAIIAAGVTRIVAAMKDPNPAVSGRGFAELKRAGVGVVFGIDECTGKELNEAFAKWIRTGLPFVTLKLALTLDGQIAERAGRATALTGRAARDVVHRIRHSVDALLTGIGTVLADDPLLTDRSDKPRRRKLLRAVVDSRLRLPLNSKIVKSAQSDVIVFTTQSTDSRKACALKRAGVEVVRVSARAGHVDLRKVLRELGTREILHVLLEAGAGLNGAALKSDIVDKVALFYAPKFMGTGGVPAAEISSRWFAKSPVLKSFTLNSCEPDFLVEGYFHDVYGNHGIRRKN
jgi:diaminohydroxyphosphoribosylaminopyrimidine deaminase / 5-amino-6-(5-phosphoribosylamino)uracil reductase